MFYYTVTAGPSEAGFAAGFRKAIDLTFDSEANSLVVLVHTTGWLRNDVAKRVLGPRNSKLLARYKCAAYAHLAIHLETERIKSPCDRAVFFAPFISRKLLAKVTVDRRASDIVYVPWEQEDLHAYIANHAESAPIDMADTSEPTWGV